jgi:hypothetical protein
MLIGEKKEKRKITHHWHYNVVVKNIPLYISTSIKSDILHHVQKLFSTLTRTLAPTLLLCLDY